MGCMPAMLQPKRAAGQLERAPGRMAGLLNRAPLGYIIGKMAISKEQARLAFSARLVEALAELPVPVVEFAAQKAWIHRNFEVSGETARKWLQGVSLPTQGRWAGLAEQLGVLPAWIRDGVEPKRPVTVPRRVTEPAPGYRPAASVSIADDVACLKFAIVALAEWVNAASPIAGERLHQLLRTAEPDLQANPFLVQLLGVWEDSDAAERKRPAAAG